MARPSGLHWQLLSPPSPPSGAHSRVAGDAPPPRGRAPRCGLCATRRVLAWGTKAGRGAARLVDRCCCIARGRRAHARWSMEGKGVRGSSRCSLAGVRCHRGLCPGEAPFDVRPHRLVATRRRVDARGRSPVFSRRIHGSERRSVVRQCGDGNRCVRMYVSVFSGSGAVVRAKYRVSHPAIPGFLSVWRVDSKLRSRRNCGVQASNAVRIRAASCQ